MAFQLLIFIRGLEGCPLLCQKPQKIERQKEVVSRAKDKYDNALDELERLMQKREELRRKELMDAVINSDRTYDEIMKFLKTDGVEP